MRKDCQAGQETCHPGRQVVVADQLRLDANLFMRKDCRAGQETSRPVRQVIVLAHLLRLKEDLFLRKDCRAGQVRLEGTVRMSSILK